MSARLWLYARSALWLLAGYTALIAGVILALWGVLAFGADQPVRAVALVLGALAAAVLSTHAYMKGFRLRLEYWRDGAA